MKEKFLETTLPLNVEEETFPELIERLRGKGENKPPAHSEGIEIQIVGVAIDFTKIKLVVTIVSNDKIRVTVLDENNKGRVYNAHFETSKTGSLAFIVCETPGRRYRLYLVPQKNAGPFIL